MTIFFLVHFQARQTLPFLSIYYHDPKTNCGYNLGSVNQKYGTITNMFRTKNFMRIIIVAQKQNSYFLLLDDNQPFDLFIEWLNLYCIL